jgi:hypothetical protein
VIAAYALAAWTLLTWGLRVRNALGDGDGVLSFLAPAVLLVLAVLTVVSWRRWAPLLAIASILAWLIRLPIMLTNDHGVGFVVVHVALAVIAWVLAALVIRSTSKAMVGAAA